MKNFNVNLTFTANTAQAKAQMRDLQTSLSQLSQRSDIFGPGMKKNMSEVKSTIDQVKIAFQQAMDPTTGQMNLNTLRASLNAFGLDASKIKTQMGQLGVEGQMAFLKMQNAVQNAQMPLKRTDTILTKMWGTLANTARWQMSSAALMAVTSTFSSAMQYAQDLNKSLNNIRIVTGYNTTEMEKFAKQANKAAKALSVSTTEYTDAALIYYQQGLSNEEVLERAEVTVKLANAVGESAQTVSEWMTAVWNNFDDGSKSLEYYADVMAALGAATASSADEIAQGLEKFAAIADTVGLSYEYATAALTTVTAQTRQSADVVGTAFKTMFARIQDLELGKHLDDGTTLGEYSETLHKVGVEVLTLDGQMRDMDVILNDLGARWDKLSKAEQVAVAQGVAGIRQYSQMLALMDNWEEFQSNLNIAQMAEGSLDVQADIYAESWEAASKRVKASAEGIYDSILNDKVFIGLTNIIADMLEGVEDLVDAMGGLPGVLALIATGVTRAFGPQILGALANVKGLVTDLSGAAVMANSQLKQNWANETYGVDEDVNQRFGNTAAAISETQEAQAGLDNRVQNLPYKLSPEAEAQYKSLRASIEELGESYVRWSAELDQAEQQLLEQKNATAQAENSDKKLAATKEQLKAAEEKLIASGSSANTIAEAQKNKTRELTQVEQEFVTAAKNVAQAQEKSAQATERKKQADEAARGAEERKIEANAKMVQSEQQYTTAVEGANNALDKQAAKMNASQAWMNMVTAISSVTFALSSLNSIISTLQNPDMSPWEKFVNVLTSIGMILPMVIMSIKTFKDVSWAAIGTSVKGALIKLGSVVPANKAEAASAREVANAKKMEAGATMEAAAADTVETGTSTANAAANKLQGLSSSGKTGYFQKDGQWFTKNIKTGKTAKYTGKLNASGAPTKMVAGAGKAGSTATTGGAATFGQALSAAAPALIGTVLIGLGIAAAVTAVIHFKKHYNQAEKAAQTAAKRAKEMQNAYTKAAEQTQKMSDAFDAYDTALDKTRQLAKGTLEYKQALMEANEKAWDLINTYGLTQDDYKIVNGEVIISQEAQDKALEEQMDKQQRAQMASAQAQTNANSARLEANKIAAARKVNIKDSKEDAALAGQGALAGAGSGALIGAGVGTFFGPWGTAIGAGIGALAGGLIGAFGADLATDGTSKTESRVIDDLTKRVLNNEDMSYDSLKEAITDLDDTSQKEIDTLIAVAESNAKLIQANEALYDQIGLSIAEQKDIDTIYAGVIGNVMSDTDEELRNAYEKFAEKLDDNDKQMQQAYEFLFKGYRLEDMDGDNISIRNTETGELEGGGTNAYKQADIARKISEQLRANMEADEEWAIKEDGTFGTKLQDFVKAVTGSGNGGMEAMIKALEWPLDSLNKKLQVRLEESKTRREELETFDIYKDNETALGAVLDQMDRIIHPKGDSTDLPDLDLADAGLTWQDATKLEKDLYQNWSNYSADVAHLLKEGITNFEEDMRVKVEKANKEFDLDEFQSKQIEAVQAQADIDAQVFATYVDSVEGATGATTEFATELAKVNLTVESSVKSLHTNFKKYSATFATANKTSLEWSKGITAIKNDLEGLVEGFDADTKFVEDLITSGQLATLLDGENSEADFLSLMETIAQKMVDNTNTPENVREAISNGFANLDISKIAYGSSLADQSSFDFSIFKKAIDNDELLIEDAIKLLAAQGYRFTGDLDKEEDFNAQNFEFIGLGTTNIDEFIEDLDEKLQTVVERYHEINEELDDIGAELSYINKLIDKAYGKDRRELLKLELKKLELEKQAVKEKYDEAVEYLPQDWDELVAKAQEYGVTNLLKVNKDTGAIEGYRALLEAVESKFGIGSDPAQELKDAIDKYEKTNNERQSYWYELQEKNLEQQSKILEEALAYVTDGLELNESITDSLEYQLKVLGDAAEDTARKLQLISSQTGLAESDYNWNKQGLITTLETAGITNASTIVEAMMNGNTIDFSKLSLTSDEIKQVEEYAKGMREAAISLQDYNKQVQDTYIEGFEKYNQEFEKHNKDVEYNASLLEKYRNIIDLVGKDALDISDELMDNLSAAAVKAAQTSVEVARAAYEFNQKSYVAAEKAFTDGLITEETFDKVKEEFQNSEVELLEALAKATEAAAEEFENKIARIMEDYSKAMGGIAGSIEDLTKSFEQTLEVSEFYFQDYKKIYETNKLNRSILEAIDKTDSAKAQRELAEIAKEVMSYQEQGAQMTEWDLNLLEKKFALKQAEIALEEAQNAKREVRLTRDSQGNYGYIYTANEEEVNKAQQNMEDALFDLQDYLYEMDKELTNRFLSLNESFMEEMAALDKNAEDYEERAAEIVTRYGIQFTQLEGEMQGMVDFGKKLNSEYGTSVADTFHATMIGSLYQDTNSFKELTERTLRGLEDTLAAVGGAHTTFASNVSGAFDAAGTDIGTFSSDVDIKVNGEGGINDDLTSIGDTVSTLPDKFDKALNTGENSVLSYIDKFIEQYGTKVENINTWTGNLLTQVALLKSELLDIKMPENVDPNPDPDPDPGDTGGSGTGGTTTGGTGLGGGNPHFTPNYATTNTGGTITSAGGAGVTVPTTSETPSTEGSESVNSGRIITSVGKADFDSNRPIVGSYNSETGKLEWYYQDQVKTTDGKSVDRLRQEDLNKTEYIFEGDAISTASIPDRLSGWDAYNYAFGDVITDTVTIPGSGTYYKILGKWYYSSDVTRDAMGSSAVFNDINELKADPSKLRYDKLDNKAVPEWALEALKGLSIYEEQNAELSGTSDNKIPYINNGQRDGGTVLEMQGIDGKDPDVRMESFWYSNKLKTIMATIRAQEKIKGVVDKGKLIGVPISWLLYDDTPLTTLGNFTIAPQSTSAYRGAQIEKFAYISKMNTGGYTGEWGPEGKLAVLHQKEIVLNAHDTENLLTTVQIVRSMADKLELSARLAQQGLGAVASVSKIPGGNGTLDQNVTIHAEFPNATNHLEIEEAFRNLTNMAAQYASRR